MDIKNYINQEVPLFALFIGRSSSGKSAAAASMPKPFQEEDFDNRANGIINAVQQGWLSPEGIDIQKFDAFGGYTQVEKHFSLLYTMAAARQLNFKTIDIGSLDSLHRLLNLSSLNSQLGHMNIAGLAQTGPADYKFESTALHRIIDYLRMLPCNVVFSSKVINKYGKAPGAKETDPNIILGERLTLTENLSETVIGTFNDVYKFTKQMYNGKDIYYVEFISEIARNSFGIPPGKFDITRKPFWPFFQNLIKDIRDNKDINQYMLR